jgi:hypothetical protein
MFKHRHAIAATTFLAALIASAFPAHAGLIGGSGGLGGGLAGGIGPISGSATGSLAGQGSMQTPSPRPLIDRTQDKAAAAKDTAVEKGGAAKDAAAAKAASISPQAGVAASADSKGNANGAFSGSVQR